MESFYPAHRKWRRSAVLIAALAGASLAFGAPPSVATDELTDDATGYELQTGPSEDQQAIVDAATDYVAGDAATAVSLASSASAQRAVPLAESGDGVVRLSSAQGAVAFGKGGDISIAASVGLELRIDLGLSTGAADIVDDSMVVPDAAPATDMVARATDRGVQVLAILADETASNEIVFPLDVPDGTELAVQNDGSIAVLSKVEREVELPGEAARTAEAVEAVVGEKFTSIDDLDSLTDEEIELLAALPDPETRTVTEVEQIAEIEAPWAVDADGQAVPTQYILHGNELIQIVDTSPDTAFPVVADPSWKWWVEKGAKCAGGAISLGALGYAKIAVGIAKLVVKLRAAKAGTSLAKAYSAWKKLGSSNSAIFKEIVKQIKALGNKVVKHGYSGIAKHKATSSKAAASITLLKEGAAVVAGVFGLGACYDMIRA